MRWWMGMWLAVAAVASAPSVASAGELVEMTDRLGETSLPEAEAARQLLASIRTAVADGSLVLPAGVADKLAAQEAAWGEARDLAMAREYGAALKIARKVRPELRSTARPVFEAKAPSTVTDALRAYVEIVGPRVRAIELQIENFPLTNDGRMFQQLGAAHWEEAVKAAKKKRWDEAFRVLMEGLGELDATILECYPPSR